MPCILKVRIIGARGLPIMDRTSELTDAYVEVKFGDFDVQKTAVCKKSLNPNWSEDFRFEVSDDADLQNEPLELKVFDYDTITLNDPVGTVFVDLNPLLSTPDSQISGWFPIVDTLKGVRGELMVQVKLQLFGDANPFKDSSAGVKFFSSGALPVSFHTQAILGSVDALVNEFDLEHHWSDSFRTPRTSNESRLRLLYRFSGQLRRQIGRQVLEMNGNAVIGFQEFFDIEPKTHTITARAIGTACILAESHPVTPGRQQQNEDVQLFSSELLTLSNIPLRMLKNMGGLVCARSVKILGGDDNREAWWNEIRDEIKMHAKTLNCAFVVGYSENTSVCNEICVLSAIGTAVNLDFSQLNGSKSKRPCCSIFHVPYLKNEKPFPMTLDKCLNCRGARVPEVVLATIAPPKGMITFGQEVLIEAHTCRAKKRKETDVNANIISDAIPFADYDIHSQLMNKLKILGFNAVFSLKWQVHVGQDLIVAIASGTAFFVPSLAIPSELKITRNIQVVDDEDRSILAIQKTIMELSQVNHASLKLMVSERMPELPIEDETDDLSDIESEMSVVPIDDETDEDFIVILMDPILLKRFQITTTDCSSDHDFALMSITRQHAISSVSHHPNRQMSALIQGIYDELLAQSLLVECVQFSNITFQLSLPSDHLLQIDMCCMAHGQFRGLQVFEENLKGPNRYESELSEIKLEQQSSSEESDSSFDLVEKKPLNRAAILSPYSSRSTFLENYDHVQVTMGSSLPALVVNNFGRFSLHLIQEELNLHEQNIAFPYFVSNCKTILFAMIRSYVASLGGNAAINVVFEQMDFCENFKNQGYGLISVSGDIVEIEH